MLIGKQCWFLKSEVKYANTTQYGTKIIFFSVEHYHIEYSWQNQKILIWNFFSSFIHFTLLRSLMFCFKLGNGMVRNETKWMKKNVILKFFNHPGDITTSLLFVASNLVCAYYSLQQSHGKYNLCALTFSYRTLWAPRQSLFRGRAERTEKKSENLGV